MKGFRIREEMNGVAEPPGKTWFWELEAGVIDADRCIQCGTCVAVCPSNSIGIDEDTELPELVKMCTGCSLCWDFCPRGGLRYEALWPPSTVTAEEPGPDPVVRSDAADGYWKITGGPPGDGLGAVQDSYAARAASRPDGAQDGGVVSALLVAALAGGDIDGALVTRPSDDPDEPWKGVAHLATTADEITEAAGSYYNQTMALAELDLSRYDLPAKPRIAVVGTPCEIQGIRAMQARRWPTGAHRVDAVVLTIALMCTKSFDYRGLMLQLLREDRGIDLDRVSKVDVIRGRMIVEYRDGEVAVDEPIKNFHGAALKGCDECADFLGRGRRPLDRKRRVDGRVEQRPRADRAGPPGRRQRPGPARPPRARQPGRPGQAGHLRQAGRLRHPAAAVRPRRAPLHRLRGAPRRLPGERPGTGRHRPVNPGPGHRRRQAPGLPTREFDGQHEGCVPIRPAPVGVGTMWVGWQP